jgi:phage gp29-like protein
MGYNAHMNIPEIIKSLFAPKQGAQQSGTSSAAPAGEIAVYQLVNWLVQLPDPDEVLMRAGLRRSDLRRLEGDDEISQCLDTRKEAVLGTPWRLEPNSSRANKWLLAQIEPHIHELITGAFNAVPFGYSAIEVVYKQVDGRVVIDRLSEKPMEWFTFHAIDGWMLRLPGRGPIQCDPRKFFFTVRGASYRNPYGEALLSRLYWPVFFRSQGWKYWMQFLERFGTPMLLGNTPGDPEKMARQLAQMTQDSILVTGPGATLTAVESGKDGQQFTLLETAVTRRIEKLILGQTLTSGTDGSKSTSNALGRVHNEVRDDKRRADTRLISQTIQRLVNTLAELNGMDAPEFVMTDDRGLESERAARDALLVEKGVLKLTEEYLLDRYDYKTGDFTIPEVAKTPIAPIVPVPDPVPAKATSKLSFAASTTQFTPGQQAIEDRTDEVLDPLKADSGYGLGITDADIKAAVKAARSPQDLTERLAVLLRDADTKTFDESLSRALFAADIMGYAHAG